MYVLCELIMVVIAVIGFGTACFSIGYTIGKDRSNKKTRK
jgi:hypothetical protein